MIYLRFTSHAPILFSPMTIALITFLFYQIVFINCRINNASCSSITISFFKSIHSSHNLMCDTITCNSILDITISYARSLRKMQYLIVHLENQLYFRLVASNDFIFFKSSMDKIWPSRRKINGSISD